MKKVNLLLFGFLFGFLFVTTSCSKDDDETIVESEVLAEYVGEYVNIDPFPAMIKSSDVNASVLVEDGSVYVIDIRDEDAFNAGHIKTAVNVAFGDMLTHYETNDLSTKETVAIVCFSGQTASYGASLLRMLGYTNVKALKWGMSSWNSSTSGSWSSSIANTYATQMSTEAATKNTEGELPTLTTGKTTGEEILRAQVEAAFTAGFTPAKITNQSAFDGAATNYTVNYWSEAHYNIGHIPGAIQYTPKETLSSTQELKTLPTDKTVVVYCYTGQTSAFTVAYLRVMGYDAKTLLFGANGMMYDILVENAMTAFIAETDVHEYELIVTE
jgi:rhodanese-related sulfurtransferase